MKKIPFFILLFICTSCSIDRDVAQNGEELQNELINEAKNIFELETTRTASIGEREGLLMQLGTMTPLWDLSRLSLDNNLYCIDVPLLSDYRYRAMIINGEKATMVPVYHNIVYVKSSATKQMSQYLHYYIPDIHYVRRHKEDLTEKYVNCGNRGDFCGIEIFTDIKGVVWRINRYNEGIKHLSLFMGDTSLTILQKQSILGSVLNGIWLQRGHLNELTRAYGPELGDWVWDGRWEYTDSDGNHYTLIDLDGDGNPDSVIIEEIIVEDGGGDDETTTPTDPDVDEEIIVPEIIENVGGGSDTSGGTIDGLEVNDLIGEDQAVARRLFELLKLKTIVKSKIIIKYGATTGFNRAELITDPDCTECEYNITIRSGYNRAQLCIVLAHEFVHIYLFSFTKNIGNFSGLEKILPELAQLYTDILTIDENGDKITDYNQAHHEYMARHPETLAYWLRELNPEEASEYSNYGKWAGGLMNTDAYQNIPFNERHAIEQYLLKNKYIDNTITIF